MAIQYDNSVVAYFIGPTYSTSYTMGSSPNGFLVLNTSFNVTAATYGGQSMSQYIHFEPSILDGNQTQINVYTLANPPSGTNTLTVTVTSGNADVGIASWTGVDTSIFQPVEFATGFTNNGVNNTLAIGLTTSIITTKDRSWTVMCTRGGNNFPRLFTANIGTLRVTDTQLLGDNAFAILDSNGVVSPAGSSSLRPEWTSGTGFISNVIFSLSPAPNGGLLDFFP